MERGHDVVGLDTGFYREGWLYSDPTQVRVGPQTLWKDLRRVDAADLAGCDCIVHLAELSNDPLGELRPEVTSQINHAASVRLARLAKQTGVPRFVYTSSCSVYGAGRRRHARQRSRRPIRRPPTRGARSSSSRISARWRTTLFSRVPAKCHGLWASPRMRFDLVLNNLAGLARTTGRITMTSDGTPWRPLVHVLDICEAIACAARGAARGDSPPDLQRRRQRPELPGAGDRRPGGRRLHGLRGRARRPMPTIGAVIACRSTRFTSGTSRLSVRVGRAQRRRTAASAVRTHRSHARAVQVSCVHPPRRTEYLIRTQQLDHELFWRH